MLEAITFDFWDTMAIDDSDEPKRRALGLPSKADARIELFASHVTQRHPQIAHEQAVRAYRHAHQNFQQAWHEEQRTPGMAVRMYDAYEFLGLRPGPGRFAQLMREVDALVREIETMEVRIQPDFTPGVHAALEELSLHYKLGIISDTIHTTGRGLRYLLQRQGLLRYFNYMLFSDEIGASKPESAVFRQAALGLGAAPHQIVHIGDRESNDVAGPLSIGMNAILFTGVKDRGSASTQANAVCGTFSALPGTVRRLSAAIRPPAGPGSETWSPR